MQTSEKVSIATEPDSEATLTAFEALSQFIDSDLDNLHKPADRGEVPLNPQVQSRVNE